MAQWLERGFTDRKVRGSNPTSASQLTLSRLRQPGSIPTLAVNGTRAPLPGIITIIIDSMTSVLNTNASLPYNHDLFESLIMKKKNKDGWGGDLLLPYYNHSEKLTTRSPLTSVGSNILQRLQPGTLGITRSPSWKASSTDSTQAFRNFFHTLLPGQGLATSLLTPL
ncbi:hypothetical protein CSKR_111778 [Clonorchis sinensis]|uniref:Uncharacterized protein n=1 Tax=Clonorchis sinensis TaxID=79923 RepID=A0A419PGW6_CLOSI|nr:hypothetical protein CSKR_111778 [Clonorchis sinensis]